MPASARRLAVAHGRRFGKRSRAAAAFAALVALSATSCSSSSGQAAPDTDTTTPIKHVVVIFQENVSFDHYFGTYPNAANTDGTTFTAQPNTPKVDGLTPDLLTKNPNKAQPVRLGGPNQQVTCDQDHEYKDEQLALNGGKMDQFVEHTNVSEGKSCKAPVYGPQGLVMGYYDGNSVTALWNYAQHYAMSDNSWTSTFGPSTVGALNLVAGQTHGVTKMEPPKPGQPFPADTVLENAGNGQGTVVGDPQPYGDDCSNRDTVQMSGTTIGDLLTKKGVSWGFFQGGFKPTDTKDGKAVCGATHNVGVALGGTGKTGDKAWDTKGDYIPHHEPFQYFASTANPHHLPPTSVDKIGHDDQANHQYDLTDFWAAADKGNMPAVSYLKAAGYQDGHAAYSDPLDEQQFLVETINHLQKLPDWKDTAVVIAYDDSDGWYDHTAPKLVMNSASEQDGYSGPGVCGDAKANPAKYQGRCGYGQRVPLLVVSPYSKANFVDHGVTDQASVLKFIEDNWKTGRIGDDSFDEKAGTLDAMFDFKAAAQPALQLDPKTGAAS
ncbi:alkaline phosphatase family protein [Nocardia sp. NPDC004860]|uniref:phospholipase C n=1 Tax=Nocardia sp. NPDC004860 TaxID=3154557 RepID=UPI0033B16E3B